MNVALDGRRRRIQTRQKHRYLRLLTIGVEGRLGPPLPRAVTVKDRHPYPDTNRDRRVYPPTTMTVIGGSYHPPVIIEDSIAMMNYSRHVQALTRNDLIHCLDELRADWVAIGLQELVVQLRPLRNDHIPLMTTVNLNLLKPLVPRL